MNYANLMFIRNFIISNHCVTRQHKIVIDNNANEREIKKAVNIVKEFYDKPIIYKINTDRFNIDPQYNEMRIGLQYNNSYYGFFINVSELQDTSINIDKIIEYFPLLYPQENISKSTLVNVNYLKFDPVLLRPIDFNKYKNELNELKTYIVSGKNINIKNVLSIKSTVIRFYCFEAIKYPLIYDDAKIENLCRLILSCLINSSKLDITLAKIQYNHLTGAK